MASEWEEINSSLGGGNSQLSHNSCRRSYLRNVGWTVLQQPFSSHPLIIMRLPRPALRSNSLFVFRPRRSFTLNDDVQSVCQPSIVDRIIMFLNWWCAICTECNNWGMDWYLIMCSRYLSWCSKHRSPVTAISEKRLLWAKLGGDGACVWYRVNSQGKQNIHRKSIFNVLLPPMTPNHWQANNIVYSGSSISKQSSSRMNVGGDGWGRTSDWERVIFTPILGAASCLESAISPWGQHEP